MFKTEIATAQRSANISKYLFINECTHIQRRNYVYSFLLAYSSWYVMYIALCAINAFVEMHSQHRKVWCISFTSVPVPAQGGRIESKRIICVLVSFRTKKIVLLVSTEINVEKNTHLSPSHMPHLNMYYLLECGCDCGVRVVLFCFVFLNLIKNCFFEMPWVLARYRVSYRYRGAVRIRS